MKALCSAFICLIKERMKIYLRIAKLLGILRAGF